MSEHETESELVEAKLPCDTCGSSDALALYDDDHTHCFSCGETKFPKNGEAPKAQPERKPKGPTELLPQGEFTTLNKRHLTAHACRKWGYSVGKDWKGVTVQIAAYLNEKREVVAQKVRYANKDFRFLGDTKKPPLYGQWLWKAGGRRLVITEGELDAISVSLAYSHKFPVVSVPNGAQGAKKALQNHLEWVDSFDEVVLAFDNDEVGRKASQECALLFPAGKAMICYWEDAKDANEMLVRGDLAGILKSINDAQEYRPDEIVNSKKIGLKDLKTPLKKGAKYPFPKLQKMTYGARGGELVIWTAGSGIGKSTLLREFAYTFVKQHKLRVGMIFLEEDNKKTAQSFIALDNNVPLSELRFNPNILSDERWDKSYKELFESGNIEFYNHFGSLDASNLLSKIRFMIVGLGINFIFLDHISIVVSGSELDDERKALDLLMTNLRSLVQETGAHISAIVHLKRKSGDKSFNEGAQVSLTDLRGSAALEQLSDAVIALERNQQAEEEDGADHSLIRILKNREVGNVGVADSLIYHKATGRMTADSATVDAPPSKKKKTAPKVVNDDF